jgi:hypothetical protein
MKILSINQGADWLLVPEGLAKICGNQFSTWLVQGVGRIEFKWIRLL